MHIQILGSAAGGGFPQWNCNCNNCRGLREGTIKAQARTQSSIAVSPDGVRWILINTSPDIRQQILDFPPLQPGRAVRDTAINGIVLVDSQIDHATGLLMLREGCPHTIYCTDQVYEDLSTGFPIFKMLEHWNGGLKRQRIGIDEQDRVFVVENVPELEFTAIPILSNAPPYSPRRDNTHPGDNIALRIRDSRTGGVLLYAPGLGKIEDSTRNLMAEADCLLVDGTVWNDDEMLRARAGTRRGQDMGHLAQGGEGGMVTFLDGLTGPRKILIHINNTNPILNEESPERALLDEHGIEVAFDGMSISL
ncbi:pyrroloquinoline quinone biosynthesis protein PqqB [Hydrocarboniclastica marina]|uniref:Coenzyme PQQ synthesis protein B n=1 Tax=Hydrocarboniclastica marina TaxID=2259620 RepID=A0A4P7XFL9_9ALTE|nr:pyrroloquinoline quinone biosynthesis protein PqqB [Hydrocarboniclastica marina]MAL97954.1 pyrroloquinoline quinone biosynthesis protein PqqB [Alteromonadaceae bacterium]QCF24527.1 pyrroloquinoline quinone biosynthesis protein PqqB [Hydrocarboniclastica marina]|tara:strand:- start:1655 stop:2575 length:921 start_codon:yes stop_codon:yes gene_type:complete